MISIALLGVFGIAFMPTRTTGFFYNVTYGLVMALAAVAAVYWITLHR